MPHSIGQVQPPLKFIPQAQNPFVLRVTKLLLPAWLKFQLSLDVNDIRAENVEALVKLYQQFEAGQVRLLFAFRHPNTMDPFAMAYLLWHLVPRTAKAMGIPLRPLTNSHFLYDRGIPLWAGGIVSWLFPRLGGSSIFRGKVDRVGLKAARELFINGQMPISLAPEGGTNEHSEIMSPLEPGAAQLGFWCVEDLLKAERTETVLIVPIGLHYCYVEPPWESIEQVLSHLEQAVGLTSTLADSPGLLDSAQTDYLYGRLLRLGHHTLDVLESVYARYYSQSFPGEPVSDDGPSEASNVQTRVLTYRLQTLAEVILQVTEQQLGLRSKDNNLLARCRRVEQAAWDRIYREDGDQLSPLEQGLADWVAEEASLYLRHMRIVERLAVLTGDYILTTPTANRFAEVILILWKILTWIQGGDLTRPPNLGKRALRIQVATPLSVSERWSTYATDRRSARQAVSQLTQDLQTALEQMLA